MMYAYACGCIARYLWENETYQLKSSISLESKITTLHVHPAFFVHLFAVTLHAHDTELKCLTSRFVEDVNTKHRLSFSFPQPPYSFFEEVQKPFPAFKEMK